MLAVSQLNKTYLDGSDRIDVLRDVSLSLVPGESIAVTGPSGSGKSTLLNILAGLVAADSGVADLACAGESYSLTQGSNRTRAQVRRRWVGYVHQFFNLIPTLTVYENALLPARLNKLDDADQRVRALLHRVGVEQLADAFPERLSGGEQQRVAVARALVTKPALLLADEPTGNLDALNASAVSELLYDAAAEYSAMLVVATHSEDVAARAVHRLHLQGALRT